MLREKQQDQEIRYLRDYIKQTQNLVKQIRSKKQSKEPSSQVSQRIDEKQQIILEEKNLLEKQNQEFRHTLFNQSELIR